MVEEKKKIWERNDVCRKMKRRKNGKRNVQEGVSGNCGGFFLDCGFLRVMDVKNNNNDAATAATCIFQ
jgi:MoaA/NifB/PqqE/SkfB family radical SAM enzyme